MSDDIKMYTLEQSLINYLTRINEVEASVSGGFKRVRALSITLDTRNPKQPICCVTIGMMSAYFDIRTGLKIKGHCYGIDRYIRDWVVLSTIDLEQMVRSEAHKIQRGS